MSNSKRNSKLFALTLLASLLLLAAVNVSITAAQGNATVIMVATTTGTTSPASPGTYTYADGTSVTFTATPNAGLTNTPAFVFVNWNIITDAGSSSVTTNPLTFPVTGGTTYTIQAVFAPIQTPPGLTVVPPTQLSTAAIVVVLASAGGTVNPAPGTYAMDSASNLDLTATPNSGWMFDHWVIYGPNLSHGGYPYTATPTDNPYNVNHGYGSTFSYQAIFSPVGGGAGATPTPSSGTGGTGSVGASMTDTIIIVALVVVVVVVLIAFGAYAMRKKK